jgi:hypothetical protein
VIDERTLADASRCPACGAVLASSDRCPACGVALSGSTAAEVWETSVHAAELLRRREELLRRLRAEAQAASASVYRAAAPPDPPAPPAAASVPAPESTPRSVQNVLLGLGVLLLGVAAVIFLVVSWGRLGVGGRAAVMAGCTVLAGAGATLAFRRGLAATAEAVALLTVGLSLLDAYGARRTGLAGLDAAPALPYWAGALALIAAAAAIASRPLPLRSLRIAATGLGQVPGPLLAADWSDGAAYPAAVLATVMTVQVVLAIAALAGRPFGRLAGDAWVVLAAGAVLAWIVASAAAGWAAYDEGGAVPLGCVLLLVLAGAAVAAASRAGISAAGRFGPEEVGLGAAAVLSVAAFWAPPVHLVDQVWLPVTLCALTAVLLLLQFPVPPRWRLQPVRVFLAAGVGTGAVAAPAVADAVLGPLGWLAQPWTGSAVGSAQAVVTPGPAEGDGIGWPGEVTTPLLLVAIALVLVIATRAAPSLSRARRGVLPLLVLAVVTAPPSLDLPFRAALGVDMVLALLLLAGAGYLSRSGRIGGWELRSWLGSGAAVLALTVAWSFASARTTLAVLPAAAAVLVVAAWQTRGPLHVVRVGMLVGAILLLIGEAAAGARYHHAGWPAVWSIALSLAAAAAAAGAAVLSGAWRARLAALATALACADGAAVAVWRGGSAADAGLAVAVAGGLALVVTCVGAPTGREDRAPGWRLLHRLVAAVALAVGVLGATFDTNRLWLALLAAGVAVAVAAATGVEARLTGWLSGLLLAASSWVRLALSDVDAPEAYTAPAGTALLVVAALRRRRDPAYRSWPAFGPGLSLVLVPSLLRAVTDAGSLRPLLLGLLALGVLGVGVARRLQAPLVIGGGVLAVDGVVQLSPYLADLYAAVPRWTVIGTVGLLLLALGVTYERRMRELRLLQRRFGALG